MGAMNDMSFAISFLCNTGQMPEESEGLAKNDPLKVFAFSFSLLNENPRIFQSPFYRQNTGPRVVDSEASMFYLCFGR